MARIPVRFKRLTAEFDGEDKGRLCESSGSEHSPAMSFDLSELVNSFINRENRFIGDNEEIDDVEKEGNGLTPESDLELKETLRGLLGCGNDEISKTIYAETEQAYRNIGDVTDDFKRRLMARLRQRGFDAGLCKSKWDRNGRFPSGSHEYVDVNVAGTRYVVDICLSGEFEIARSTVEFATLLQLFPQIFVGKVEDMKQIVRHMYNAVKKSMKSMDMHIPPWRHYKYMQAKWLGSYKRTTNEVPEEKMVDRAR